MIKFFQNILNYNVKEDHRLKEVVEKGSVAFLFKLLGVAMFFLFNKAVIFWINPDAWGIFSSFHTVMGIVAVIAVFGCDTAMVRFMSEFFSSGQQARAKGIYHQMLKGVIVITMMLSLLLFLLSPLLNNFYVEGNMKYILALGSLCIFPMAITSLHAEGLRGMKKVKEFSYLQQGTQFGLTLLVLLAYFLLKKPVAEIAVAAFIISMWLIAIWSILLFRKHSGFGKIQSEPSGFSNFQLLQWVLPMVLSGILQIIMSSTDLIILGNYVTMDKIGIYRTGLQIAGAISVALFAVNTIVAPKFAELYAQKDMQGLALVIRNTTRFMFILAVMASLLIFIFPKLILGIFSKYYINDEAIYTLFILTISQLFNVGFGSVLTLLNMTGRQKVVQNIVIIGTLINIILCIIFIKPYGIIGAATANALSMLIWNTIAALYIKKHYKIWTIAFFQ
jgi:O-antigen/teichoic acid export membrane protein